MREIKFKYYFLLNKVVVNTKIFIMEDIEDINFNTILFLNVDCNKDNFENMELYRSEYIGLKDKNGVEIYEGDIIKYDFNKFNYRIEFLNAEFIARRFYENIENLYPTEFDYGKECEVVGNIYENKELLN